MTISNGPSAHNEPENGFAQHTAADPPLRPDTTLKSAEPRRWRSSQLLGSRQEIEIEHGASVYRLRLTSQGKLILTK